MIPQTVALDAVSSIMDFLVSIVEWLRRLLPLDGVARWIQTTLPFLEDAHTPIVVVSLAVLVVWFIWSWASQNLRRHSGYLIVFGVIIAIAAYMGAIIWS